MDGPGSAGAAFERLGLPQYGRIPSWLRWSLKLFMVALKDSGARHEGIGVTVLGKVP